MKRILFITPSKSIGGTNSSLSSLISYLSSKCKIDVLLLSSDGIGRYDFLKYAYTDDILDAYYTRFGHLKGKAKYLALVIKIFKRFHIPIERLLHKYVANKYQRKYSYDIVVGFSEGKAMKLASEFKSLVKYTWIHCEYDRAVPLKISELAYYTKFQKVICVSEYTKKRFLERYPILKNNTISIYNLMDINRILFLSAEEIDDERFIRTGYTIISVGRIDPVKQFSRIPQIARQLIEKKVSFVWYIIGGPQNEEYSLIESEIIRCGVSDNVVLLGQKSNPYPYFKQADLYVSTSKSEACPMVFNEAKLIGLPIISSDFASAYEFISDKNQISSIENIADLIYDSYRNNCTYQETSVDMINSYRSEMQKIDKLFTANL